MVNFNVDLSAVKGHKDLFATLASFGEVFGEEACGKCNSKDVSFVVRTIDDNVYHEKRCNGCYAKLSFGSHKKGDTLFPKRKEGDTWLPNGGWMKYDKETGKTS